MSKAFSSFLCVCILVMTVVSLYDNAQAQTTEPCTYTVFKYPGTRTTSTAANGINKYGTIVGTAQDQTGITFGFVRYSDGGFKRYAVSGSYNTEFFHRNDNGVTVGFYQSAAGGKHGLLVSGSALSTIDYPGAIDTVLTGINKWGTIVGYYTDSSKHFKGFKRYSNGGFAKVSIPNYSDIMPMDIDDSGVIVGTLGTGGPVGIHGFWLSGANWQILDDPDYPAGSTGLNGFRGGVYVGEAFDSNGTGHAIQLVVGNSSYSNFVVPKAVESFAGDVLHGTFYNTVVGGATISGGGNQAFIAQCQ